MGKFVFLGDAGDNRVNLTLGVLASGPKLGVCGLALGMIRSVFLCRISQTTFCARFRALELKVDGTFLDRRNRLDVGLGLLCALHLLVCGLGFSPLLPCGNQSAGKLLELLGRATLRHAFGIDNPLALAELLQRPLRLFQLLAQARQPFGQPGAGLLCHCQTRVHVRFDKPFRNPVGGVGGKLFVVTFVADLDQLAVAHQFYRQLFSEPANDSGLESFRSPLVGFVVTQPGCRH